MNSLWKDQNQLNTTSKSFNKIPKKNNKGGARKRDTQRNELLNEVTSLLGNTREVKAFLRQVIKYCPRDCLDQLKKLMNNNEKYSSDVIHLAILACKIDKQYSASAFIIAAELMVRQVSIAEYMNHGKIGNIEE